MDDAAGCLQRASEVLQRPEPWHGLAAATSRAEGILETARGNDSAAEQAFIRAVDTERRHGFPYHEAQTFVAWSELHFQRNEPGDTERGLEKLDQALAIFEQCQAKKDVERVLARRSAVGHPGRLPQSAVESAVTIPTWQSNGLTAREGEVASLAARGLSNREIAERLVIAEGTARTHVERILRKLGLRSRAQLAAWAGERGLLGTRPL
ncbi:MAG: response regulator transcription factor [Chloroflexi bacterium]|nr:response regulator transcription factor [Chloroflexota bacterium]